MDKTLFLAALFANKASAVVLNRATGVVLTVLGAAIMIVKYFVVMTGFTINLIPKKNVMTTEKPPMVELGTRLAT